MKKLLKFALMLTVCLAAGTAFGQKLNERINTYTPQLVYNYENKLKIVWPIFFNSWTGKPQFELVHETQSMVTPLLTLLSKIEGELNTEQPIIVHVDFQNKFNEIKIEKQTAPLAFTFRDTLLEFDGKNHLIIHRDKQAPIDIYFNKVEDLQFLKVIQFQILENYITADIKTNNQKKIYKKKEMLYLSQNGELKNYGVVGREKHRSYGASAMTGGMLAYSKLGIGLNAQLNLLNYKQGNDNQKHLATKLSLDIRSYYFEGTPSEFQALFSSVGFSLLANQQLLGSNLPIDMIGFGVSIFNLYGINGYQLQNPNVDPLTFGKTANYTDNDLTGITYSIIAELQKIHISYDMNLGIFNKPSERSSFGSLNVAYKF